MNKRLLVLRHAKAEAGFGLADHERPLAERGLRDTAEMGAHLRAEGLRPDLVLCSTALRTRQTLEGLGLDDVPVSFERGIYTGDGYDLLTLVQITPAEVGTLLLVGHNPAVHELVIITGNEPVAEFPTCALGVVELAGWESHGGSLLSYRTPKTLR
ncbi:histidine phosphatase family protein [Actinocorallia sp. API 0066]|uniref:SixA phosphatase family protein n=1 Tax=Actinocorallia sp. API 0066 TaxID=2896846 RepID=UPI001E433A05|nr:histidine phosphatase family protein [Actinocorallia sp. API 0066]MCD0450605.1 histidine phosphatase family protein [Actinocorallia sp. API 0066]